MLVLSRTIGESIVIGEGPERIVVQVVDIRRDKVRLGIVADVNTPVHREEVYNAIQAEKGNGNASTPID